MSLEFQESMNSRLREQLLTEAAEQRGMFIENAWSVIIPFALNDAETMQALRTLEDVDLNTEHTYSFYTTEDFLALPEEEDRTSGSVHFRRSLALHFVRSIETPDESDTLTLYIPIDGKQSVDNVEAIRALKKPDTVYVARRGPKAQDPKDPAENDEPARLAISYDSMYAYTTAADGVETVTEFEAFEEVMAGMDSGKTNTGLMLLGKLNEDLLNMRVVVQEEVIVGKSPQN